ncbi:MAG: hemolysin family protein [Bacilli bacterium]
MDIVNLILFGVLLLLTAFFVSSEFAIVKVRSSRIDQLLAEGNRNAKAVRTVIDRLDEYLSLCQLGITVTALGLGWIGESTVERLLHPIIQLFELPESMSMIVSVAIAFSIITFLHVVLGELAPKTVAIQQAETVSLWFAPILIVFYRVAYPFIWLLNGSARMILKIFGMPTSTEHESAHTEEEIQILLQDSLNSGEINQAEFKYVNSIFEFDETIVREIMVPRVDMSVIDVDDDLHSILKLMATEKYTRYPVIDGDKDHILGFVNYKQITTEYINNPQTGKEVRDFIRPVIQTIETTPIATLLMRMQKERVHLAIVIDEYGGTNGLVTVEDILEEIVGDIHDEFDNDEIPDFQHVSRNITIVSGKVGIEEIKDELNIEIAHPEIDTIAGWLLSHNINIRIGDSVALDRFRFTVLEKEGNNIKKVQITEQVESQVQPTVS